MGGNDKKKRNANENKNFNWNLYFVFLNIYSIISNLLMIDVIIFKFFHYKDN